MAWLFGSPLPTNTRNSTRATFVSTMAARSSKREAADRARGIGADPLEREQRLLVGRQLAAVARRPIRARSSAGAAGGCYSRADTTSSVTSALRRRRERVERRILLQPLGVLRQHAIDLGLLQHDFGDEDVVRIARLAPRQIASVAPIPGEQALAEPPAVGRGARQRQLGASSRTSALLASRIIRTGRP